MLAPWFKHFWPRIPVGWCFSLCHVQHVQQSWTNGLNTNSQQTEERQNGGSACGIRISQSMFFSYSWLPDLHFNSCCRKVVIGLALTGLNVVLLFHNLDAFESHSSMSWFPWASFKWKRHLKEGRFHHSHSLRQTYAAEKWRSPWSPWSPLPTEPWKGQSLQLQRHRRWRIWFPWHWHKTPRRWWNFEVNPGLCQLWPYHQVNNYHMQRGILVSIWLSENIWDMTIRCFCHLVAAKASMNWIFLLVTFWKKRRLSDTSSAPRRRSLRILLRNKW